MLVFNSLYTFAKTQPDKKCIIHGSTQLTYQELAALADNAAGRLAGLIKKGDKVLIRSNDSVRQLCYLLGIARLAAASVLVDPSVPADMYENILKTSEASLCIDDDFSLPEQIGPGFPEVRPDDLFFGALSSGSTGEQKLIWRDHQSWVRAFPQQSSVFGISGHDTLFLCGSLIYTANLNSLLHMLAEGGTVVLASGSFPQTWLKEIIRHNVSSVFMVPAHYRALLKVVRKPVSQVKSLVSSGAKMDQSTVRQLMEYFPWAELFEYYGASELGHVSFSRGEDLLKHTSSVGKAFPGVKLWIENSLIWVESPYLAPAYQPRATVGDLGEIDQEGYLYLRGRDKNVINKGGVKIPAEYVEQVLILCPGVAECAVQGVENSIRGQQVAAWIVKSNPDLTVKEIKAFCHKSLPKHARPQKFIFIEKMPRNTSGKLEKQELKIPDDK